MSTDDLRQVLAEVEGKKPTQRVMTSINYLDEDEATLEDVAERYGYTAGCLSRWLDRLERLATSRSRRLSTTNTVPGDRLSSLTNNTTSSLWHSTNHPKKLG
jgi:DNA-binding MarR family transcriptional regulator